jgi:hypothetical protein
MQRKEADIERDGSCETVIVRRTPRWSVEHEPVSDCYLLVDSGGAYCADLHWKDDGECWAHFDSYVAFSGPTTIGEIEALRDLADLLRTLPCPGGHRFKNPP